MASRRARELSKKIPKEAVVLFDCDNTTDIRPTNTIIDERDKVYTGNTVTLQYGDQQLTAKIIKLSDDRTVLTEAQRQLCAQLDAQVREPPKKRPKTTSAALLGVSEFPECESISNSVDALLDDTCVESEFPREAAELPLVSTPANPTTRPAPVEFNTPEPSVHKACISHDKIREIMRECLLESERKNTEKWLKYEQNVIQLQHQNLDTSSGCCSVNKRFKIKRAAFVNVKNKSRSAMRKFVTLKNRSLTVRMRPANRKYAQT